MAKKIILIVLVTILISYIFYPWIIQYPYGWMDDDAYFYTQIAYNIANNKISSFDGINITDGYHILWMGILVCISKIVGLFTLSKEVHLYFFILPSMFLLIFIPVYFGRNFKEKFILFGLILMGKLLMETQILCLFFLLLLSKNWDNEEKPFHGKILFPLLFLLIPLTRIDASIIVICMLMYFLLNKKFAQLRWLGGAFVIGSSLHFLIMKSIAGHWFSVSSILKSAESSLSPSLLVENLFTSGLGYTLRAFLLLILSCVTLYFLIQNKISQKNIQYLFGALGILFFSLGHLYFSWLRSWYYIPGHLVFTFLFFQSEQSNSRMNRVVKRGTEWLLIVVSVFFIITRIQNGYMFKDEAKSVRTFIKQIEDYTQPETIIFQRDGSGYTGYFCKRTIMNGDGLVNSHDYANYLLNNKVNQYLNERRIYYIIANMPADGGVIDNYFGFYLEDKDVDLLLEKQNNGKFYFTNFRLYKRKKPVSG